MSKRPAPRLELTEAEANIAAVLRNTCEWITAARPPKISIPNPANDPKQPAIEVVNEDTYAQIERIGGGHVEARIAGGWVRDKLLQRDSDDLDVSLSSLTGFTFAHFLAAYLASPEYASSGLAARIAASAAPGKSTAAATSSIAKIAANPEQSKSLETATAKVFGLSLDFVNLRKEEYDGDTRIPIMSFGTAQEDAERRDITINSLFYNVHTEQVEDLTGKGLDDLANGIVRTPLPAYQTFIDDPLRVLRCIRFAARFGYTLHPEIVHNISRDAAREDALFDSKRRVFGRLDQDPTATQETEKRNEAEMERARAELAHALSEKVSRERFGIEVDKMIRGPDPLRAITMIIALELYSIIFAPPPPAPFQDFVPFELDPAAAAVTPSTTSLDNANKAVGISGSVGSASTQGYNRAEIKTPTLAFRAASQLQYIWDHAEKLRRQQDGGDRGQPDRDEDEEMTTQEGADTGVGINCSRSAGHPVAELKDALRLHPQDAAPSWVHGLPKSLANVLLDKEQRGRLFMAAALLPLDGVGVVEAVGGGGGGKIKKIKLVWAGEAAISNALKLGNRQAKEPMLALFRARYLIDTVLAKRAAFEAARADASAATELGLPTGIWPDVEVADGESRKIAKLALLLRQPSITLSANHLRLEPALVFALVARLAQLDGTEQGKVDDVVRDYVWLWEQVSQFGLVERAEWKPILDGKQIMAALGFHPGPLTPRIQTAILAWQYARLLDDDANAVADIDPCTKADPAACERWLKEAWDRGEVIPPEARQAGGKGQGGSNKKKGHAPPSASAEGDGQRRKRQKSEEK